MQVSEQVDEIELLKEVIQLSEDGALMDQYIKAEREIERLRGCKFSDRNYSAMQSRLEEQAVRIMELETLRGNSVLVPGPALKKMQDKLRAQSEALKLAAQINPYGSVENAKARDAACAAVSPESDSVIFLHSDSTVELGARSGTLTDQIDAHRFRWLMEDHRDSFIRADVRELFKRLPVITISAARAAIDSLMIEHCPDEMTKEQMDEWAKHQRPVSESAG